MRDKLLAIAILILTLASCKNDNKNFEINIKSSEYNNMIVKIFRETEHGLALVDSSKIEMSRASFKGEVSAPELMYIYIDKAQDYLPVFVENSQIDIDINSQKISKSSVLGSESNKILTDFLLSYSSYSSKQNGLNKMITNAYENNDSIIISRLENDKNVLKAETIGFQRLFIGKYISSPIACYILSSHLMYDLSKQELQNLLDSIPESNRDNKYYFKAKNYLSQIKDETTNEKDSSNSDTLELGNL